MRYAPTWNVSDIQLIFHSGSLKLFLTIIGNIRSCFEFLQKVFLGLMYPFSCVLWAIFWSFPLLLARYLPHSKDARFCVSTKTHPKSSHDKFKTASKKFLKNFCLKQKNPSRQKHIFVNSPNLY